MKPTTNQILAALNYPLGYDERSELYASFMDMFADADPLVVDELMTAARWDLEVDVVSAPETSLCKSNYAALQVPIEPIWGERDTMVALAWLLWPTKGLELVGKGLNLLRLAHNAGLLKATYNEVTDSKGKVTKRIDPGAITLGFELAGIPAPYDYVVWREPDNQEVPVAGNVPNLPSLGNVVVHYHNGQKALVTGRGGEVAQVIYVTSIEGLYNSIMGNLTKEPKVKRSAEEISLAKAKELAAKFMI